MSKKKPEDDALESLSPDTKVQILVSDGTWEDVHLQAVSYNSSVADVAGVEIAFANSGMHGVASLPLDKIKDHTLEGVLKLTPSEVKEISYEGGPLVSYGFDQVHVDGEWFSVGTNPLPEWPSSPGSVPPADLSQIEADLAALPEPKPKLMGAEGGGKSTKANEWYQSKYNELAKAAPGAFLSAAKQTDLMAESLSAMAAKIAESFPKELKAGPIPSDDITYTLYGKPFPNTMEAMKGYAAATSHQLINMLDSSSEIQMAIEDKFSLNNHVVLPSGGAYKYNLTITKLEPQPDKEVQK